MVYVDEKRAERLVALRMERGLERQDVCKALKIKYPTYGNYEDAQRNMKAPTARRLASFFGVNFEWFNDGIGPMRGGKPDAFHGLSEEGRKKAIEYIDDLRKIYPG